MQFDSLRNRGNWGQIKLIARSRPVKFVLIGIVNTIFGYLLYACVYLTTGDSRLAIVIATLLGVIFNFFTTGRIVFKNTDNTVILRFVAGYAVSLIANIILLECLTRAGVGALIGQAICLPPVVLLTYFLNARLVFRKRVEPVRIDPCEQLTTSDDKTRLRATQLKMTRQDRADVKNMQK